MQAVFKIKLVFYMFLHYRITIKPNQPGHASACERMSFVNEASLLSASCFKRQSERDYGNLRAIPHMHTNRPLKQICLTAPLLWKGTLCFRSVSSLSSLNSEIHLQQFTSLLSHHAHPSLNVEEKKKKRERANTKGSKTSSSGVCKIDHKQFVDFSLPPTL